jgi:hypothetical protein
MGNLPYPHIIRWGGHVKSTVAGHLTSLYGVDLFMFSDGLVGLGVDCSVIISADAALFAHVSGTVLCAGLRAFLCR